MKNFLRIGSLIIIGSYCIYSYKSVDFIEGFFYGSTLSYINSIGVKTISNLFISSNKSKFIPFFATILKISILALVTLYLVKYLSINLIGFLTGFSVILIVFILLIQGK